jgi:hypothetical protein
MSRTPFLSWQVLCRVALALAVGLRFWITDPKGANKKIPDGSFLSIRGLNDGTEQSLVSGNRTFASGQWIPWDLNVSVQAVLNPFASIEQPPSLNKVLEQLRPVRSRRVRESSILACCRPATCQTDYRDWSEVPKVLFSTRLNSTRVSGVVRVVLFLLGVATPG